MSISEVNDLRSFLKQNKSSDRLVIRCKKLWLVDKGDLTFWECVTARFGRGNASMKKVAQYIHDNRDNFFPEEKGQRSINNRDAFNSLIDKYNCKKWFRFKKAQDVGCIGLKAWDCEN